MVKVSRFPRFYYFKDAREDVVLAGLTSFAVLFSIMRIAAILAILFVLNMVMGTSLRPITRATKALQPTYCPVINMFNVEVYNVIVSTSYRNLGCNNLTVGGWISCQTNIREFLFITTLS